MTDLFLLAQSSPLGIPQPAAFGSWMINATAAVALVYMLAKFALGLYNTVRRRPPLEAEFATKRELHHIDNLARTHEEKTEKKIGQLSRDLTSAFEKIEKSDEARTSGIHKRLDVMAENLGEMKGTVAELPRAADVATLKTEVGKLPCKSPTFKGCKP